MKKITRMVLISAIFVTSGLTAKVAHENYKAVVTNDERIHKAYELAKKPSKAAVLEAIVDATNVESDERIQDAVVIDPNEPKVVRVKNKVTTSAGVSPIASVMDKKTFNKAEEFIENVAHPTEVVAKDILDSLENIPDTNIPVQELVYEMKDIFPEFEEVEEEIPLTYKIKVPVNGAYFFNCGNNDGSELNVMNVGEAERWDGIKGGFCYIGCWKGRIEESGAYWNWWSPKQGWEDTNNAQNIIKFYLDTRTLDYSALVVFKNSADPIPGIWDRQSVPSYKEVYEFLAGVEKGKYPQLTDIHYQDL